MLLAAPGKFEASAYGDLTRRMLMTKTPSNPPQVAYGKYHRVGGGVCCLLTRRIPSCLVLSLPRLNQRAIDSQNELLPSLQETLAKAELKIVKGKKLPGKLAICSEESKKFLIFKIK